ncbi:hypothetical protein N8368_01670 [Bacteroidia bacterium]|nr:hypothetical protein [Bacteroidia bacterium]
MFKFNSPSQNSIVNFITIFLISIFSCACQGEFAEENKHIDDLKIQLAANKPNADIDIGLFESRIEFIESTLRIFSNDYKESMSLELGNSLSRYKAIKKIYTRRVGQFHANQKEHVELETQLNKLKSDVSNALMTKEEFKQYYTTEKTDVLQLLESSNEVKKGLYELELDYTRITKELKPILAQIKD